MGVIIGSFIIFIWFSHLIYSLFFVEINFSHPLFYLNVFLQAYLYTGLFITGHDAMHGNISKNKKVNNFLGRSAVFLFAGLSYKKLIKNHYKHHTLPGTEEDPDFKMNSQNFFIWWLTFLSRYATVFQLIIMAVIFNFLKLWFDEQSIWFFWVLPAFLASLQLFYFGTYLPHKYPHDKDMKPHNARTQKVNHLWAMISCYFFGYHREHHEYPRIPWWKLYRLKNKNE